jgi:hypothetical protein
VGSMLTALERSGNIKNRNKFIVPPIGVNVRSYNDLRYIL